MMGSSSSLGPDMNTLTRVQAFIFVKPYPGGIEGRTLKGLSPKVRSSGPEVEGPHNLSFMLKAKVLFWTLV